MIRLVIPGGWYTDALGDEYCALVPHAAHVQTHAGTIPCPLHDEPLWLAIAQGKFAGQAHNSARTLEYVHGTGWRDLPAACGTSPVIYDRTGQLHISDCSIGSQGWRYVAPDGSLVTGDATSALRHGLNEWTDLSDAQDGSLLIGQGNPGGGVRVFVGNVLRVLHPGACFDIRAKRAGEQVVISFYEVAPDGLQAYVYRLTVAELAALPLADTPIINPPPKKEDPPVSIPDQTGTIAALRQKFPTPLGDKHAAFLILAANATGAKLLQKDSGSHVTLPNGINVSQDILVFSNGQECFDVLGDAEGKAIPSWQPKGAIAGTYIDVSAAPPPSDPPPPGPAPTSDLAELLSILIADVRKLSAHLGVK